MEKEKNGANGRRRRTAELGWLILAAALLVADVSGANDPVGVLAADRVCATVIDGFYDPAKGYISATARLRFAGPVAERCLWLAEGLTVSILRDGARPVDTYSQNGGLLMVNDAGAADMELAYSGCLDATPDTFDLADKLPRAASWGASAQDDECRFLSNVKDYYPHPSDFDFGAMRMSLRVPSGWNCLGSGALRAVRPEADASVFVFDAENIKGMSLVFGRFRQIGRVAGTVPTRLYGWPGFRFAKFFSEADVSRPLAFFSERFGPLDVPELNLLFRRGRSYCGVSSSGLVVLNIDSTWRNSSEKKHKVWQDDSPLSLISPQIDLLVHELSHQWWGGVVSWEKSTDNWITEGLATYSSLLYLRECRGDWAYRNAVKRFRYWVRHYADQGVTADGCKLKLLGRDVQAYQALVYAKPALMLAVLADAIGESELCGRLRSILQSRRHANLKGAEFIRLLAGGDERLETLLRAWVLEKKMPNLN